MRDVLYFVGEHPIITLLVLACLLDGIKDIIKAMHSPHPRKKKGRIVLK